MNPSVAKFLHKIGVPLYCVKENDFVGFFAAKISEIEDKPHLNSFKDGEDYFKYEDIRLFKCNANKLAKQKTLLTFHQKYDTFPKENVELAERLNSMGLILTYREYDSIVRDGKNSKYYKELYEAN